MVAIVAAVGGLAVAAGQWRAARAHLDRGETRLVVFKTAGAQLRLFRAGDSLDDAEPMPLTGDEAWLPEGNYFVEARHGDARWLYPVPLRGLGEGPSEDGSFPVTIRTLGFGAPPALDERVSRYAFVPGGHFALGDAKNPGESHFVFTTAFFAGIFEVTNGEFRRFLDDPKGYGDASNWTAAGWRWASGGTSQATAQEATMFYGR